MMQVHTSTIGDATVLSCDGRLTMVAAPTLRSAIDDAQRSVAGHQRRGEVRRREQERVVERHDPRHDSPGLAQREM